jgi:hypothetical protein
MVCKAYEFRSLGNEHLFIVIVYLAAGSSNGRTSPSGGEYLGSSPSPAAKYAIFVMNRCSFRSLTHS